MGVWNDLLVSGLAWDAGSNGTRSIGWLDDA